jgi:arsenate reductase
LAVAEELGVEVDVVAYMKEPPDEALLRRIVDGLEDPVEDLVRKDSRFKKLELNADDYVGDPDAVVALLAEQKALLQRPVIIKGDLEGTGELRAIIGRPKDRIGSFIDG